MESSSLVGKRDCSLSVILTLQLVGSDILAIDSGRVLNETW
jgi:hypothetical protein